MSIRVMSLVWEHSRVSGGPLLVLLAIADAANDDGYAFPSIPYLAKRARLSRRAAQYAVRDLARPGEHGEPAELEIRQSAGPHGANLYRINLAALTPATGSQNPAADPRKSCAPRADSAPAQDLHGVQPTAPPAQDLRGSGGAKSAQGAQDLRGEGAQNLRRGCNPLHPNRISITTTLTDNATHTEGAREVVGAGDEDSGASREDAARPEVQPVAAPVLAADAPSAEPGEGPEPDPYDPIDPAPPRRQRRTAQPSPETIAARALWDAFTAARYPDALPEDAPALDAGFRAARPDLADLLASGITPQQFGRATANAMREFSSVSRVSVGSVARNLPALLVNSPARSQEPPAAGAGSPASYPPQGPRPRPDRAPRPSTRDAFAEELAAGVAAPPRPPYRSTPPAGGRR